MCNCVKYEEGKSPLYDEIKKFGFENFTVEKLYETKDKRADEQEEYFIKKFNCFEKGYNKCRTAIATNDPYVMSKIQTKEARERKSKKFKEMNNKNWKDPKFVEKMSKTSSELQKERLKNPEYLKEKTDQLKKATDKMRRRIAQYTLDGKFVRSYNGLREAQRESGISISSHLREPEKRKQAGGYVWKYL